MFRPGYSAWQIRCEIFINFTRKLKVGLQWIYFYCIFRGNSVLYAVSCVPGCGNDQPSTSCALLRLDYFNVLTKYWPYCIYFNTKACLCSELKELSTLSSFRLSWKHWFKITLDFDSGNVGSTNYTQLKFKKATRLIYPGMNLRNY